LADVAELLFSFGVRVAPQTGTGSLTDIGLRLPLGGPHREGRVKSHLSALCQTLPCYKHTDLVPSLPTVSDFASTETSTESWKASSTFTSILLSSFSRWPDGLLYGIHLGRHCIVLPTSSSVDWVVIPPETSFSLHQFKFQND